MLDDEEREERMDEHVDGHAPDRVERRQQPHGVRRAEPEYVFPLAYHDERLIKQCICHQSYAYDQLEIQSVSIA